MRSVLPVVLLLTLAGCGSPGTPRLETAADSLAFRVTEAAGGLDTWNALPGLAFQWAVVSDSVERVRNAHVWDKRGDRVRSEFLVGRDSVVVAIFTPSRFDPDAPDGQVALNGVPVTDERAAEYLSGAQSRFVNDSYWLLAPLKVLDPGVVRTVETADGFDRLALTFDNVGLTPGDRYSFEVDAGSGAVTSWRYVLESGSEGEHRWVDATNLDTPRGPLTFSRSKTSVDGRTAILTEPEVLAEIDETLFTDLSPRIHTPAPRP